MSRQATEGFAVRLEGAKRQGGCHGHGQGEVRNDHGADLTGPRTVARRPRGETGGATGKPAGGDAEGKREKGEGRSAGRRDLKPENAEQDGEGESPCPEGEQRPEYR